MPQKTRSPCLSHLTAALAAPQLTHWRESSEQEAPTITPETIAEKGVRLHHAYQGVKLREDAVDLGGAVVLGREAAGDSQDGPALVKFRADLAVCDILNLNWRYYPRSAYEGAIQRAQADLAAGKLTGLLEHPGWDDGWKGRLDAVAARWIAFGIEERAIEYPPGSGNMVTKPVMWGEGVYTRLPAGETVRTLMEDGVHVGISTNGYSSVEYKTAGELGLTDIDPEYPIPVTGDDFTLLTADFVSLPSNFGGQVYAESGGYGPPPMRKLEAAPRSPSRPGIPEPAPQTEGQEVSMHPKLKALLERLGKTLEQVKAEHATEYLATLEAIQAEAVAQTEAASQLSAAQAQLAQTQTLLAQTQQALRESESNRTKEARTVMVDSAIAAANLPVLSPLTIGEETVDLNAKYRDTLLAEALAAESDEAAQTLIDQSLTVRAHEISAHQESASVRPPRLLTPATKAPAPTLPSGNNDAGAAEDFGLRESAVADNPLVTRLRG